MVNKYKIPAIIVIVTCIFLIILIFFFDNKELLQSKKQDKLDEILETMQADAIEKQKEFDKLSYQIENLDYQIQSIRVSQKKLNENIKTTHRNINNFDSTAIYNAWQNLFADSLYVKGHRSHLELEPRTK
jgi:peptidoglycan hydrolase CwlO-like protein